MIKTTFYKLCPYAAFCSKIGLAIALLQSLSVAQEGLWDFDPHPQAQQAAGHVTNSHFSDTLPAEIPAHSHATDPNVQFLDNEQFNFSPQVCDSCSGAQSYLNQTAMPGRQPIHTGYHLAPEPPFKYYCGFAQQGGQRCNKKFCRCKEKKIPWENYGVGEYIGPHRTPHVSDYRLRVDDEVEFVFQANRTQSAGQYRLSIGDIVRVVSATDERLNAVSQEEGIAIMSDGTISLDIIGTVYAANLTIDELTKELDERYAEHVDSHPRITVSGISTDTRLRDFLNSVDARAGTGGQSRQARVTADGTLRLPLIGAVRVVGLTLDELEREVNGRFNSQVPGVHVSVVLAQQAPRFMYVMGEVEEPGRFELNGPTSITQAIALAGGWNNGGNLKQVIVFRRDQQWQLMALRLNLRRGLNGLDPLLNEEIWLRDSDVVLIPKRPIVHVADAIELYFTRTLYALFPSELGVFDAQSVNAN